MYKYFEQVKYTLCSRSSAGVCGGGGGLKCTTTCTLRRLLEKRQLYTHYLFTVN